MTNPARGRDGTQAHTRRLGPDLVVDVGVDSDGGDPACKLSDICPRCAGLDDEPPGGACRRCGAPREP